MARLRLRLLVQEFDLKGPEVTIGRSPNCHLTIEDPMVSRLHARIRIVGDRAYLNDMQSRNGIRVNGKKIRGEVELHDTDRIRIGTREMVFSVVGKEERLSRTTGYLRMCASCGTPFPDESAQCPHCGHVAPQDEDTVSGMFQGAGQGWTVDLFCDVVLRALDKGRPRDAVRMMRRLRMEIEERMASGFRVSSSDITKIAQLVVRMANSFGTDDGLVWLLKICQKQSAYPAGEVLERVAMVDLQSHPNLKSSVDALKSWMVDSGMLRNEPSRDERSRLSDASEHRAAGN